MSEHGEMKTREKAPSDPKTEAKKFVDHIRDKLKARRQELQIKKDVEGVWLSLNPVTSFGVPTENAHEPFRLSQTYYDLGTPQSLANERVRIVEQLTEGHDEFSAEERILPIAELAKKRIADQLVAQEGTYDINEKAGIIFYRYDGALHIGPYVENAVQSVEDAGFVRRKPDKDAFSLTLQPEEVPITANNDTVGPEYTIMDSWKRVTRFWEKGTADLEITEREPGEHPPMTPLAELVIINQAFVAAGADPTNNYEINPNFVKKNLNRLKPEAPFEEDPYPVDVVRSAVDKIQAGLQKGEQVDLQSLSLTPSEKGIIMATLKLQQRETARNDTKESNHINKAVTYVLQHPRF